MRPIDANALKNTITKRGYIVRDVINRTGEGMFTVDIMQAIDEQPTVETEHVKHEECEYVITKGKAGYREECKCSACGDSFYWTQDRAIPRKFNYCRNCGRKVIRFVEKEVNTIRRKSE